MDAAVDLSESPATATMLEARLTLEEPQPRVRVRLPPGQPGRAEAVFDRRSWAAKHYWLDDDVVVYEFDEPLPAGPVLLRIPFTPA